MMHSLERGMNIKEEVVAQTIPLGPYGESNDITDLALFLSSDESTSISGSKNKRGSQPIFTWLTSLFI